MYDSTESVSITEIKRVLTACNAHTGPRLIPRAELYGSCRLQWVLGGKMETFCSCCAGTPSTEVSPVGPAGCSGMRLGQWEVGFRHGVGPSGPPMPDHFFVTVVAFIFYIDSSACLRH